jgi:NADH dehydrogenase FAD-containing subunit
MKTKREDLVARSVKPVVKAAVKKVSVRKVELSRKEKSVMTDESVSIESESKRWTIQVNASAHIRNCLASLKRRGFLLER